MNWGCYIFGSCFCFVLVEDRRNYLRCLHLFSCLSLGRGVGREASVKVRCSLTVVFGFVCLATWWRGPFEQRVEDFCSVPRGGVKKKKIGRGPIEQCVGDFCSVPRGGVKKKKLVEVRLSSVSKNFALCHEVA